MKSRGYYKRRIASQEVEVLIEELFELLSVYLQGSDDKKVSAIYDSLILTTGKYKSIQQENSLGIIEYANFKTQSNKVSHSILGIINSIPDYVFTYKPESSTHESKRESIKRIVQNNYFEYDIFLSFSSKDISAAKKITRELRGNGLRVFLSDEALKYNAGSSFFEKINLALQNSKDFVLLASENSLNSEWVRTEYETFFNEYYVPSRRKRKFILLKKDNANRLEIPILLKRLQYASSVEDILKSIISQESLGQKALEEKNRLEQESLEQKALEEKNRLEQESLEQKALEEKNRLEQESLEQKALEEKNRLKQEALEQKALEEKNRLEQESLEQKALEEKNRLKQEALEQKALEEKNRLKQESLEQKALEEKKRLKQEALEQKALEEKKRRIDEEDRERVDQKKYSKPSSPEVAKKTNRFLGKNTLVVGASIFTFIVLAFVLSNQFFTDKVLTDDIVMPEAQSNRVLDSNTNRVDSPKTSVFQDSVKKETSLVDIDLNLRNLSSYKKSMKAIKVSGTPRLRVAKRFKYTGDADKVVISRNGKYVAAFFDKNYGSGEVDDKIRIWETENYSEVGVISGVSSVDLFSFDSSSDKLMYSAGSRLFEYNVARGEGSLVRSFTQEVSSGMLHPVDDDVVIMSFKGSFYAYNIKKDLLLPISDKVCWDYDASFTSGFNSMYNGLCDNNIIMSFNTETLKYDRYKFPFKDEKGRDYEPGLGLIAVSPDEKYMAVTTNFDDMAVIDFEKFKSDGTFEPLPSIKHENTIYDSKFIDSRFIATVSVDRSISIWDVHTRKKVSSFKKKGSLSYVNCLDVNTEKRLIVIGALYGVVYVFNY